MAPKQNLDSLRVISPCTADWDSMTGNDEVRFCKHCNLNVHNLSRMTRNQAQRLIDRSNGRLCVRYYRDSEERVLTRPLGLKVRRVARRVSKLAAGAFSATLSVSSTVAQGSVSRQSSYCNTPTVAQNGQLRLGSSIVGAVKDQNGALVTGATIFLWNEQTNLSLYTSSDLSGEFRFDGLESGTYNLRIEAPGFAPTEVNGLYVQPNDEARVDRTLSIASLEETVEIESRSEGVMGGVGFVAPANPFIKAAQEDNLEAMVALLAGTDVNLRDKSSGTTALEHAVRNANREMVQALLLAGADVNARNSRGETVLMMLGTDATSDLVWDLINAGASADLIDENGNTALMQTAESDSLEAVKILLDAGAKVNARNRQGQTALMLAASEGRVNVARALVLAGAEVNATDKEGKHALTYAVENEHAAVVRFLRSQGAQETVSQAGIR